MVKDAAFLLARGIALFNMMLGAGNHGLAYLLAEAGRHEVDDLAVD